MIRRDGEAMQAMKLRRPTRTPLIGALVGAGVLVAGTVGMFVVRDDGDSTSLTVQSAAQVSSLREGCEQWLTQAPARTRTPSGCPALTAWMSEHMAATGTEPQMMWGGPAQMRTTCRQWVTAEPSGTGAVNGADWCDAMVDWMGAHLGTWSGRGDWDEWMMHGPMMGR